MDVLFHCDKSYRTEEIIPWKIILLWLVLILETALMGFMAYRLFQQMGGDEDKNN